MKNKFLLLGATALLSTGLVINALAEDKYDPTGSVTLKAYADFTSPIRAGITDIYFGHLDPVIGGEVIVNPDGTSSGNAILVTSTSSQRPMAGEIELWGGFIGTLDVENPSTLVILDLEGKTITLREESDNGDYDPNGTICGTVKQLTPGGYEYKNEDLAEAENVHILSIKLGGTLEIAPKYNPDAVTRCYGKTTVTYLLNPLN